MTLKANTTKEESGIAKETNLIKVTGPEHKVKLSTGEEVEARPVTHDYYNENTSEAKEKYNEEYDLLTKTTGVALLANGEEKDSRTTVESYSGQEDLGWKLRKPTSVITDPNGLDLVHTTEYNSNTGDVIETKMPAASGKDEKIPPTYTTQFGTTGSESEKLSSPSGVAIDAHGNFWILARGASRIEEFSSSGSFIKSIGSWGTGALQFKEPLGIAINPSTKNIYIGNEDDQRIDELNEKGEFVRAFGYGVSNGEAKLETCTTTCQSGIGGSAAGQFNEPEGVAIDSTGKLWIADYKNNRVDEFSETGEFIAAFGYGVVNGEEKLQTCTTTCKAGIRGGSGNGELSGPTDLAFNSSGDLYVTDSLGSRVEEFNTSREYLAKFGSSGSGNGQFSYPGGIAVSAGGNVYVDDWGNSRVEEFTSSGSYLTQFGTEGTGAGQLKNPERLAITSAGDIYVTDTANNRMEEWAPTITGNEGAHDTKTIYYTAKGEAEVSTCRNHPEWAGLVCQTEPAAQPGISASPELPIDTVTSYNIWDDAEVTEAKFGSGSKGVTRTEKQTYDPAGRALTSEESASPEHDTALPIVTNEYNTETGALEKQSATIAGKTRAITNKYSTLGQLVEYTDAEGNVAKYIYEEGGEGRLDEISEGKGEEAKSTQKYTYNTTTGFLEKLEDSAAGTFTAGYDIEGKMTSEIYPNGMCASTTYNSSGEATNIEYLKTRNCSEKEAPLWFSDGIVSSIHGEALQQTSTLAKEKYKYDNAGRLTETQETPTGKGCTSQLYAYDEESNRTSLTTRESATETCATEGGTAQNHSYDSANRLIDSGVEYETFSSMTKLPAADAGEHEIVSTYYVDSQVATQTQNEQLSKYTYDPAGNVMETVSENTKTKVKSTIVSHYAGGELSWTCQEEGKAECAEGKGKWTRNIVGLEGGLVAVEEAGKSPILQLHDLQGNIVATAEDNESSTKVISTYNSTEFGVPHPGTTPPKYAWLGAYGVSTEPSQAAGTSTTNGDSYVPEIGQPLQTGAIETPGEFPNGTGGVGRVEAPYLGAANGQLKEIAVQEGVAREEAKRKEAEERAKLTERPASETQVDGPGEGNCETNCEINEEEEGEESVEITVNEPAEFSGARASLGKPIIECNLQADHPHKSSHVRGTINFEVWIQCTDSVLNLRLRAVLFRDGSKVAETGYVSKGDTAYGKVNVAVSCVSGVYQGWGYADYDLGPDYDPPGRSQSGWGVKVTIKCG